MVVGVNWSNLAATAVGSYASLSIGPPSGSTVAQGDLLVVLLSCTYDATGLTAPAGWMLLRDDADAGAGWQSAIYWKIAGASDVGTPSYSFGATAGASGGPSISLVLVDIGGADSTAPMDVSGGATGSGTSPTAPSVTTTASGDLLLLLVDITWAYNQALTFPSGWTQIENTAGHAVIGSAYQIQSSAGATGSVLVTAASSRPWVAQLVAIKPASTGGTTVTVSASGASVSGASAAGAVARPITGAAASDSGASGSASALRSVAASAASASDSSGGASARRAGAATLTSGSSVAGLVAVICSAVVSIASSTANAASTLARRAVGASSASVSTVSASASVVGSAILGVAAIVSATAMSASEAVRRGASVALDATSGVSTRGALRRVAVAVSASISAVQALAQVAGSTLVASTTTTITLDMGLSDTVLIEAGLSDTVQLSMPLEEV